MARSRKQSGKGGPKPQADRTEAILQKHIDGDFMVYPMAELPQTRTRVQAVGRKLGVTFPPEFLAHSCGRFPGVYVEVKEKIWPRPKKFDVGPFWSFLYALHTFTAAAESEPWMRLDSAAASFQTVHGLTAVPILQIVGDADLYCLNAQGEIVQYLHETHELEPVPLNFWELFEREVQELRARKDRKKAK